MSNQKDGEKQQHEPRGLGVHATGLAGEYAREQGWGTNVEERTTPAMGATGGPNYDYGARDFGDVPTDQGTVEPSPEARQFMTADPPEEMIQEIVIGKES